MFILVSSMEIPVITTIIFDTDPFKIRGGVMKFEEWWEEAYGDYNWFGYTDDPVTVTADDVRLAAECAWYEAIRLKEDNNEIDNTPIS